MIQAKSMTVWCLVVAVFTAMCLWPIWSARFPAMQDYPHHLLQAKMLAARNDPLQGYDRQFEFHLRPVYATFFATTIVLARVLPLEVAGKIALSLYIALVAILVVRLGRRLGGQTVPWGLLLLFPFAFNQQYFQGNINYCYSLPLLLLALIDQEDLIQQPASAWTIGRQFLWQVALLVTHPFTLVVFIGVTAVAAACCWHDRPRLRRAAFPLATSGLLLAAWLIAERATVLAAAVSEGRPRLIIWMPLGESVGFLLYMFTGMRWHDGVDTATIFLWVLLAAAFAWRAVTNPGSAAKTKERTRLWFACFALCLAGVVALPFQIGEYSFLNFRLASLSYFFLAALAGTVRLSGAYAAGCVALVTVLLVGSIEKQHRVSEEIQEIIPVIETMAPNAAVLPLVFERSSPQLDPTYFDVHLHSHDYYHLLKGGLSPYFLKAAIHPVHFKRGIALPAPGEYNPYSFRWDQHADNYRYFLLHRPSPDFTIYIGSRADLVTQNGGWLLFQRR